MGSFQMEVYARTTPQDNFAYFDPAMPFVKTDIQLLRQNDSLFYRVEKANGRTVVSDGSEQYMWIPNALYLKGSRNANFLERFANLMFPERTAAGHAEIGHRAFEGEQGDADGDRYDRGTDR